VRGHSAILPSTTPTGTTLAVTYNGATSEAEEITVLRSTYGIFTLNQAGSGPAAISNSGGSRPQQPLERRR
jgi:uncharacterized protein (TIGR03437 family)